MIPLPSANIDEPGRVHDKLDPFSSFSVDFEDLI